MRESLHSWHNWTAVIALCWDVITKILFCPGQRCRLSLSYLCGHLPWKLCTSCFGECSNQIQLVQFKSDFLPLCRAQGHHCGVGQCREDNHPLSVVSGPLQSWNVNAAARCHILNVCSLPALTVWRRKPSTHRPPSAATSSRSPCAKPTSWFGISEGRRAFEPAGTHTTATQRCGSLSGHKTHK